MVSMNICVRSGYLVFCDVLQAGQNTPKIRMRKKLMISPQDTESKITPGKTSILFVMEYQVILDQCNIKIFVTVVSDDKRVNGC